MNVSIQHVSMMDGAQTSLECKGPHVGFQYTVCPHKLSDLLLTRISRERLLFFFFHCEIDVGMEAAEMVEETLKLFFPCVQMINVSSTYLYQHAGFLATKLVACCSKDSMYKLAIRGERGGPMATLSLWS
jgi:hypothetical protein